MSDKKKCLVTGHKGYIGSHLYRALVGRSDCDVMGIDKDDPSGNDILAIFSDHPKHSHTREMLKSWSPDYIFHLAAIPRVGESIDNPVQTMLNNVLAGTIMLDFASEVKAKRFIYSSSSSIKGNGDGPISPYAVQKYTTELETSLYPDLFGLDTVSLRYFNVYSQDQQAEGSYATAVANWMNHLRENDQPFITGDGEQRRDMLHVDDAVGANLFAMDHEEDFSGAVFDVGTGNNISLNEMREIVLTHFEDIEFDYIEPRLGDVLETKADISKLKKLGWKTKIDIKKGVDRCFKNLKKEIRL
jgi:UDP-glucose 4-epimerase